MAAAILARRSLAALRSRQLVSPFLQYLFFYISLSVLLANYSVRMDHEMVPDPLNPGSLNFLLRVLLPIII